MNVPGSRRLLLLALLLLAGLLPAACGEPERPTIQLYRAIHAGDLDQIKRHLYWGTDINRPDADGDYPLHVAARRGRVVIARTLLEQGAAMEVRNREGQTPLEVALLEGRTQLAEVLVTRGAAVDPQALLFLLVGQGVTDRDSLALVLRLGADLQTPDATGSPVLHQAILRQDLLLAKRLIALGAEVNAPDAAGRTPLALAADSRDLRALLEPQGARLEVAPPSFSTPSKEYPGGRNH